MWVFLTSVSWWFSRTLLRILTNLNNAVVWMVSTYLFISKSSSPCNNPLVTIPSILITIGITITFIFHCFFSSLARSRYLSLFLLSFSFTQWSARMANSTIQQVPFFYWCSVCISKSQRIFCVSFCRTDSGLCIHHLLVWLNLNSMHNSSGSPFPHNCIIIIIIWVFLTTISWWSFTGVWMTASLLRPPGLFSVFWSILTML